MCDVRCVIHRTTVATPRTSYRSAIRVTSHLHPPAAHAPPVGCCPTAGYHLTSPRQVLLHLRIPTRGTALIFPCTRLLLPSHVCYTLHVFILFGAVDSPPFAFPAVRLRFVVTLLPHVAFVLPGLRDAATPRTDSFIHSVVDSVRSVPSLFSPDADLLVFCDLRCVTTTRCDVLLIRTPLLLFAVPVDRSPLRFYSPRSFGDSPTTLPAIHYTAVTPPLLRCSRLRYVGSVYHYGFTPTHVYLPTVELYRFVRCDLPHVVVVDVYGILVPCSTLDSPPIYYLPTCSRGSVTGSHVTHTPATLLPVTFTPLLRCRLFAAFCHTSFIAYALPRLLPHTVDSPHTRAHHGYRIATGLPPHTTRLPTTTHTAR